jgi:hypothetical protein
MDERLMEEGRWSGECLAEGRATARGGRGLVEACFT